MTASGRATTALLVRVAEMTNRTVSLPLVIFYPTSRCNSRCVSCDWWHASGDDDLTLAEIATLADALPRLRTRRVALSGGEPLLRPEWPAIADLFRRRGVALHLLTSGLMLGRYAAETAARFDHVTISLDASTAEGYRAVRGVDGLEAVADGIRRLRELAPRVTITARTTLHARNFRDMPEIVAKAKTLPLDRISFLPADVSSSAFGRVGIPGPGSGVQGAAPAAPNNTRGGGSGVQAQHSSERVGPHPHAPLLLESFLGSGGAPPPPGPQALTRSSQQPQTLLLNAEEIEEFGRIVDEVVRRFQAEMASGFIEESEAKLRGLPRYYAAVRNGGGFPAVACNAPWMSVVVEANGSVRPCFFHPPIGSVRRRPFERIVTEDLPRFRRTLDVSADRVCQRCVCPIKAGMRSRLWA